MGDRLGTPGAVGFSCLKLKYFSFPVFFLGIPSKYACSPIDSKYFVPIPGVLGSNPTSGSKISKIVRDQYFIILDGFRWFRWFTQSFARF